MRISVLQYEKPHPSLVTWSFPQMAQLGAVFLAVIFFLSVVTSCSGQYQDQADQENYDLPLGCEARKLCCTGRDSSCVVSEFHPNSIIEDLDSNRTIRCYCDESCLTLGDCCHDLRSYCGVTDCIVSAWGNWSECSSACGVGKMSRRRQVLQESSNGGRICPPLLQSRACFNTDCTKRQEIREVAAILPGIFGSSRGDNDTYDIRHNLRLNYPKDPQHENSREYCSYFEVTKASRRCMTEVWSSRFQVDARVCVECQKGAMRKNIGYRCKGQGLLNTETRWSAMLVNGCHGKWTLVEKQNNCHCDPNDHNSFIFI